MSQPGRVPQVQIATSVRERIPQKVGGRRDRILQVYNALLYTLPREAGTHKAKRNPRQPGSFHYQHFFLTGGQLWWIDVLVGDAGWPDLLWVVDLFVTEAEET